MTRIIVLPTYSPAPPACSPAVCAFGTQYVCPQYWTDATGNAVWNASNNNWDLFQGPPAFPSDHFWAVTPGGLAPGLRPTSIDLVINHSTGDFISVDLYDTLGTLIVTTAIPIGPGLTTNNITPLVFVDGTPPRDIGDGGSVPPQPYALKIGFLGGPAVGQLVSICFRP